MLMKDSFRSGMSILLCVIVEKLENQLILDPYDYSCIVSAVWIYPVIYIYNFSMYVCIFSVSCVISLMVLYVFAQWYFVGPLLVHVMPCCPVI